MPGYGEKSKFHYGEYEKYRNKTIEYNLPHLNK